MPEEFHCGRQFGIKGGPAVSKQHTSKLLTVFKMAQVHMLVSVLLLCLASIALSAPQETEQEVTSLQTDSVRYTRAIASSDFTLDNVSSTFEQVLADAGLVDSEARQKRRPCACSTTVGAYGGREGTAFVDVTTNPCDVHITDIWVRHGSITDAIQFKYKLPNGDTSISPNRGGTGGTLSHIIIPEGGKVIGLLGGVANYTTYYGLVISQLRIIVLDAQEYTQIYGPFGSQLFNNAGTFSVYGNIKSIFGYHRDYLDGLGVYYEPWGVCGSLCALPKQGSGANMD